MRQLRFSKLSLLSQKERSGLQINLSDPKTVLVGGNGFGKSAIVKSLYDSLGAKPHKIDASWRAAQVTNLLEFSLDNFTYFALKIGSTVSIFDKSRRPLIRTDKMVSELAPFMADLFDFRLVLADKKDKIKIPPPSYVFAPFYVDQDQSWLKPWTSFGDLGMFSNTPQALAEYHSGLKPNEYYDARANRDQAHAELAALDNERKAVQQALSKVREQIPAAPLILNMDDFVKEIDRLVAEGQALHAEEVRYREELAALHEELHLWKDHVELVQAAVRELDETSAIAAKEPAHVECPMCGAHYKNDIANQFELIADRDDLAMSLINGREKLAEATQKVADHKSRLESVAAAMTGVQEALSIKRQQISLADVVRAEGRAEAQRYLQDRLAELDAQCGSKQRSIDEFEAKMKSAESNEHKKVIRDFFQNAFASCAQSLDVSLDADHKVSLLGKATGRGSVGPRALAAYYYSFLQTVHKFGTSTFCPMVIDAPNQQGQDEGHLQRIMDFLLSQMPQGAQVIVAAEAIGKVKDARVLEIEHKKDRVLRQDQYDLASEAISPFLLA